MRLSAMLFGLALCAAPIMANAQIKLNTVGANEPITGMTSEQFLQVAEQWVDASQLQGRPAVTMINATNQEITVTCEDKWTIVGNDKYDDSEMRKNPDALKPFMIYSYIAVAASFDGYCKDGLVGHPKHGNRVYVGKLNGPDFTHSTVIEFTPDSTTTNKE